MRVVINLKKTAIGGDVHLEIPRNPLVNVEPLLIDWFVHLFANLEQ